MEWPARRVGVRCQRFRREGLRQQLYELQRQLCEREPVPWKLELESVLFHVDLHPVHEQILRSDVGVLLLQSYRGLELLLPAAAGLHQCRWRRNAFYGYAIVSD